MIPQNMRNSYILMGRRYIQRHKNYYSTKNLSHTVFELESLNLRKIFLTIFRMDHKSTFSEYLLVVPPKDDFCKTFFTFLPIEGAIFIN